MSERCKKCGNTREDLIHHRKEVLCREKFAGLDHAISDSCHEFEPTEAPAPSQTEAPSPKHTEGHVDCPACERNRWDVHRERLSTDTKTGDNHER